MIASANFVTVAMQSVGHDHGGAYLSSTQLTWIISNFAGGASNGLSSGSSATNFISGWMRTDAVDIDHLVLGFAKPQIECENPNFCAGGGTSDVG